MRVEGRNNVVHFFPALSRNYRCLRDIEEDILGVEGREGIYGDLKKVGDLDLGLEVDGVKWIVNQLMRGVNKMMQLFGVEEFFHWWWKVGGGKGRGLEGGWRWKVEME